MKEKLIKLLDKNECDIYHAIEYHEDIEGMWNRLADEILELVEDEYGGYKDFHEQNTYTGELAGRHCWICSDDGCHYCRGEKK